jgi:predicted extracellular nuclease
MKFRLITIKIFYFLLTINAYAQDYNELAIKERYFRLMFYNVENLFDTENDSLTKDEEFLPNGLRFWTKNRYWEKLQHISTVVAALGGWNPPEIIGLCEIENRKVLEDLCFKSSLSNFKYKIIHKESPDPRGIDVALLYQPKKFKPLTYKALKITFPFNTESRTRDILYVKGETRNKDTLHIFINHWPSRTGGQLESEPNRIEVSKILRKEIDSIVALNACSKIIIMGDLNDYPENKSLIEVLKAQRNFDQIKDSILYNLSSYLQQNQRLGSHKFEGEWGILDQIIVSGSLLHTNEGLYTSKENTHIFDADFLLENDETYSGKKNFRTYQGFKYHGGYSDHLPVFIDLENLIPDKNE